MRYRRTLKPFIPLLIQQGSTLILTCYTWRLWKFCQCLVMTDNVQVLWGWEFTFNHNDVVWFSGELFMGCKGCAGPGSICNELWGTFPHCTILPDQSSSCISSHAHTTPKQYGRYWSTEASTQGLELFGQDSSGCDQMHHRVWRVANAIYNPRHWGHGHNKDTDPYSCLLGHQKCGGVLFTNCWIDSSESWESACSFPKLLLLNVYF